VFQPVEERRVELSRGDACPDPGKRLPGKHEGCGFVKPEGVPTEVVEPEDKPDERQSEEDLDVPAGPDGRHDRIERRRA